MFEAVCHTLLMQTKLLPGLLSHTEVKQRNNGQLPFPSAYCRDARFCSDEIEAIELKLSTAASDPVATQVRQSIRRKSPDE